ncbi:hypothetical protein ANN_09837 [Periplaneta americana]|uniref:Mos1 transposase HTH domain-containing protein n=1 Tax=Periplaneta americana TaxID=6978 RepID=A0ABQ8TQE3_PERAM|nr:hypothetical protein ANN_09837 [Periplaneta americana]
MQSKSPYGHSKQYLSLGYLASERDEGDNADEMSKGASTENYPAFAHIGLRENTGNNLNEQEDNGQDWQSIEKSGNTWVDDQNSTKVFSERASVNNDREKVNSGSVKRGKEKAQKMECQVQKKKKHFRYILTFEFNRGANAAEVGRNICVVYSENVIGESTPISEEHPYPEWEVAYYEEYGERCYDICTSLSYTNVLRLTVHLGGNFYTSSQSCSIRRVLDVKTASNNNYFKMKGFNQPMSRVCTNSHQRLDDLRLSFHNLKRNLVYATPVESEDDLVARIFAAAGEINDNPEVFHRVRQSMSRRSNLCVQVNGGCVTVLGILLRHLGKMPLYYRGKMTTCCKCVPVLTPAPKRRKKTAASILTDDMHLKYVKR